jgi:predicted CxxxxCH...CXXCH cytochrome family protein
MSRIKIIPFCRLFVAGAICMTALVTACSSPNNQAPTSGQVHADRYILSHTAEATGDLGRCQHCHGDDLNGSSTATSCFAASYTNGDGSTSGCHASGPGAAHELPYPNRNQSHDVHQSLTGIADNCGVCHSGTGIDSTHHFDTAAPADVVLSSTYNAQTGSAAYNTPNCSNVRCHGGQTTPDWGDTGSIDVTSDCLSCHQINGGQYNSPASRVHTRGDHSGFASNCATCHDAAALAGQHFVNLATTTLEGDPADTIRVSLHYSGGDCTTACH